jgi:hypothetical protein
MDQGGVEASDLKAYPKTTPEWRSEGGASHEKHFRAASWLNRLTYILMLGLVAMPAAGASPITPVQIDVKPGVCPNVLSVTATGRVAGRHSRQQHV